MNEQPPQLPLPLGVTEATATRISLGAICHHLASIDKKMEALLVEINQLSNDLSDLEVKVTEIWEGSR